MDHVLLWAPIPTGHRFYYVRLLAQHALSVGLSVTIATQLSPDFEQNAALHLETLEPTVKYLFVNDTSLLGILDAARKADASLIVAPDGDQLAWAILRAGRWRSEVPITLLIMRPRGQAAGRVRALASSLAKLAARTILATYARVEVISLASSLILPPVKGTAPDPVSVSSTEASAHQFRLKHGLTPDRYWFAVVGALDERKNIPIVAEAISRLGRPAGLMLIGKMSSKVRAHSDEFIDRLSHTDTGFLQIDRLLSNEEIDDAIRAADCVVLAHSNEGPSGVLGKAAASGTRVIAAGARSLRRDSILAPAACTWVPLTVDDITAAATFATTQSRPRALQLDSSEFAVALLGA